MITLITLEQEREWNQIIRKSVDYDFYHTWDYHMMVNEGTPFLVVYTEFDDFIAYPLIRRSIPGSDLCDLTCVYGYTGPVSNKSFREMPEQMVKGFTTEFSAFLKENKVVSVFSRLHPFFGQEVLLRDFGGIFPNGKIVMIDLRQSLQEQRARYKGRLCSKIQKLRKNGFYVKDTRDAADVKAFAEIYSENMERVSASKCYLFDEEYFWKFLNAAEMKAKLVLVYHGQEPVCGALIIMVKSIVQVHLLATRTAWMKYSPAKLLTEEITLIGREQGMHYLNLGGGYGFKEDTLFEFKALFSDLSLNYQSWRHIADNITYQELLLRANIDPGSDVDFFPLYRSKDRGSVTEPQPALASNPGLNVVPPAADSSELSVSVE